MASWEEFSRLLEAKKLDPVGKEDRDIDNDGDSDKTDSYLLNRRKVRTKIIQPQERLKTDRDMFSIPKSERDAAKERLLAKAKAKREKVKEEVEDIVEKGMSSDEMSKVLKGHKYSKKELLDMSKKSTKEGRHGEADALYKEFAKEEAEQIEEKSVRMSRMVDRYLGKDKEKAKERLGRQNERREKKAALAAMEKQYKGMKSGIYSSYEPEGEQLDEMPYQVMGYDKEGGKEKKVGKPVKSRKYADARAAELEDTHKKTGGKYRSQYVEAVENIEEKSLRRAQPRFMGMVYAAKKGETPASPEVAKAAEGMSKKAAKDFAKTKHDKLPEKKETKEEVSLVDKILEEFLNEAPKGTVPGGKSKVKKYKAVAKQAKLAAAVNKAMKDDSEQESTPEPKKTEKERKAKAKEESKEKAKTATEKAARTTAAGRIRAAKIKRQTEREKEAARTERQKSREERADRLRAEKDRERQKGLESKEKEKIREKEKSESEKKIAKLEKQKQDAKKIKPVSLEKTSKDDKLSAAAAKGVGNVGAGIVLAGRAVKAGIKYGVAAKRQRDEKKKAEEIQKRHEKEREAEKKKPVGENFSNWREEFIYEVEGQEDVKKIIDVSKKKNKIEINPTMGEEVVNEVAPALIGAVARVAGAGAARGIAARGAGIAAKGALRKKAVDFAAKKGGEMTADAVQNKLEKKFKNEPEEDENKLKGLATGAVKTMRDILQTEDWQSVNRKDKTDGLSQKAVDAYRRENPGSKLQTAVTEKKPTGKRAERRKSFCRRMSGMKKRLTSAETARDPDSRINKALRRWNCN